ncbi:MAG: class I SAM-dependent methyltransferase [Blastocatellia bacterium]|nr:class I SAM-dependent methyltransferase [Blastocatellia bacterium]MDW8167516.1 class I SAM-dependent methyltransferase [Acidobacteriota bacterium]
MERACAVCGSDRFAPFLEKNGYGIVQCTECTFLFVHPPPDPAILHALYADPAYFRSEGPFGYEDYAALRPFWEAQARERLAVIERYAARGTLLDVGCATGIFLKVARERGWTVSGIEIAPEAAREAERLAECRVVPSPEPFLHEGRLFDVITLWEYLEHVPDPRTELHRFHQLLRPGGLLALSTPNAGQRLVRRAPALWKEFKPPEHLSFFTAETLLRLLSACGFHVLRVRAIAPNYRAPEWIEHRIARARQCLGDRHDRRTPLWFLYSITRRIVRWTIIGHHKLLLSPLAYAEGIEVYARKEGARE